MVNVSILSKNTNASTYEEMYNAKIVTNMFNLTCDC